MVSKIYISTEGERERERERDQESERPFLSQLKHFDITNIIDPTMSSGILL